MSTPFRPIEIPPGVVAMPTKQQRSSNWSEVNLMRWVEGQLTPIGGQAQYSYSFSSRVKAIHGWYDLNSVFYVAYLCEQNLYVDSGGTLTDITPTDGMAPPASPLVGGYGDGLYSAEEYGTPRSVSTIPPADKVPDAWSLDNFGQVLLAMTTPDGRLLKWDPNGGGTGIADAAATQVTSPDTGTGFAPQGSMFVVTGERFVMIFGMTEDGTEGGGSFRRFGWCDQENYNRWNFSDVTSQAGFLDVEPSSPIVAAKATPLGTLFWTGTTTYLSSFLGIPYVYNYTEIAKNCTPWSPSSVASAGTQMTLWFSQQGMFNYNGSWVSPMACKVRSWIDDDIDLLNVREQACAVHVEPFNEFWWFFPQSGQPYNTRCVIYNYKEGWWSQGAMSRSAGISAAYTAPTIMADGLIAYQHEMGSFYPADTPLPWAETFDLNLTSGSRLVTLKQMIPDIGGDVTNLLYSLFYKNSRSVMPDPVTGQPVPVVEKQTPPKPVRSDGYLDLRTTGRDIRMRIELAGPQVNPVTVGQHLIDSVARGDR